MKKSLNNHQTTNSSTRWFINFCPSCFVSASRPSLGKFYWAGVSAVLYIQFHSLSSRFDTWFRLRNFHFHHHRSHVWTLGLALSLSIASAVGHKRMAIESPLYFNGNSLVVLLLTGSASPSCHFWVNIGKFTALSCNARLMLDWCNKCDAVQWVSSCWLTSPKSNETMI